MMTVTSQRWGDLYAWQLDRASRTPLSRQIYMQVRSAVLSGALRAGTRVPSSRAMASQLGVARASVVSAYEQLLAEGYVESRHGSGTFISGEVAGLTTRRRSAPRAIKRAAVRHLPGPFPTSSGRRCRATLARSTPAARWSTGAPRRPGAA
jgi:GntR family transcriptional regulator / MocR family aminotransferase